MKDLRRKVHKLKQAKELTDNLFGILNCCYNKEKDRQKKTLFPKETVPHHTCTILQNK